MGGESVKRERGSGVTMETSFLVVSWGILQCWGRKLLARLKKSLAGPAPARNIRVTSGKYQSPPEWRADNNWGSGRPGKFLSQTSPPHSMN